MRTAAMVEHNRMIGVKPYPFVEVRNCPIKFPPLTMAETPGTNYPRRIWVQHYRPIIIRHCPIDLANIHIRYPSFEMGNCVIRIESDRICKIPYGLVKNTSLLIGGMSQSNNASYMIEIITYGDNIHCACGQSPAPQYVGGRQIGTEINFHNLDNKILQKMVENHIIMKHFKGVHVTKEH